MTREEAINVITNADLSKVEDRVIKAIFYLCTNKALEQESCDDAISRREAIKIFTYNNKGERIPDYGCNNFPIQIARKTVREILRDLPSVNPQQPYKDCISREKAKQFLYERLDRLNDNELYDIFSRIIDDMYNELPSVTPTQRWISVSENGDKDNGEI